MRYRQPKNCESSDVDQPRWFSCLMKFTESMTNRNSGIEATMQMLLNLCQRFEVTKRLHGEYGNDWRPINQNDYIKMERYIRFAEVLSIAYRTTEKLVFLNTMLKCMDTLTAMTERLNSQQKERLHALIIDERHHIQMLCQQL